MTIIQGGQSVVFVQAAPSSVNTSANAYNFAVNAASTSWTIEHTLVTPTPEVNIVVNGEKVLANVSYPNANTVLIQFQTPQTGTAVLFG